MNKGTVLEMNNKRNDLNNLIKNSDKLNNSEILNLSKELDKLIVVCQVEMNKKANKIH